MRAEMELQQMIYNTPLSQIQFGTYRYGDEISSAIEVVEYFNVSVDTVGAAYRRLEKNGYISLSKNVCARVIVDYDGSP